jgi:hypothetical protein
MTFKRGDRVIVTRGKVGLSTPSWDAHHPHSFTGTVYIPVSISNWVYVTPDPEYFVEFRDGWYCHPSWLGLVGGPW